MFDIRDEVNKAPEKPGVYLMKDNSGDIIYVGKSKSLRNRLRSYFGSSSGLLHKTEVMVSMVECFEYIVTETETEALILECTLIKKFRPKFNVLLKDDKQYPYIKVTVNELYPTILLVRKKEADNAKYFGPYSGGNQVRDTIKLMKKLFPVKSCKKKLPEEIGKSRPCLNYHIGRCLGICNDENIEGTQSEYRDMINRMCSVLEGKYNDVDKWLEDKMFEAAGKLEFESASAIRDRLESFREVIRECRLLTDSMDDIDAAAFAGNGTDVCIQLFIIRENRISGRESFMMEGAGAEDADPSDILQSFIKQYYSIATYIPRILLVPSPIEGKEVLEGWLTSLRERAGAGAANVRIIFPLRGAKKQVVELAEKNARIALKRFNENATREENAIKNSLSALKSLLSLNEVPVRIEAYDVSNNGDTDMVAAKVVFTEGKPQKRDYRRYGIRNVEGIDDYACMREVLNRRINRADEEPLPNLILVDGGVGHVHTVEKVLRERGFSVKVAGMVKDEKHRLRALISDENEIGFGENIELLRFITSIQNEVHRSAIEYNRKKTSQRYRTSLLDNIPGIGRVAKKELIKHFGSVNLIRNASHEELCKVKGISHERAERIIGYFRKYK